MCSLLSACWPTFAQPIIQRLALENLLPNKSNTEYKNADYAMASLEHSVTHDVACGSASADGQKPVT